MGILELAFCIHVFNKFTCDADNLVEVFPTFLNVTVFSPKAQLRADDWIWVVCNDRHHSNRGVTQGHIQFALTYEAFMLVFPA